MIPAFAAHCEFVEVCHIFSLLLSPNHFMLILISECSLEPKLHAGTDLKCVAKVRDTLCKKQKNNLHPV
jgi:hypothetical protein